MTYLRITPSLTTMGCLLLAPLLTAAEAMEERMRDYNVTPVPFSPVHVDDGFWTPRIETIQQVTIPDLMEILEDQGKLDNLRIIAGRKKRGADPRLQFARLRYSGKSWRPPRTRWHGGTIPS